MGGIWFSPHVLADTLSETVGYKTGLALSVSQICDHLKDTEYPDLILASEEHDVRIRAEEYEALFHRILYRVGYIEEEYDGDTLGINLFHKYKERHLKEWEGIMKLFTEMWPKLIDRSIEQGDKSIDPTPFLEACFRQHGRLGLQIAMEQLEAINKSLYMSPYSPLRYFEWREIEKLDLLFIGSPNNPEKGKFIDQRFIDYLSINPDKLETMHWRKFEELTAEFFFREGFKIKLGPGRDDDGVDIRIWRTDQDTNQSPHCIIQCKRQKQKIEKVIVKGLYADILCEKAEYGLIVTSSELSVGARHTISARGYPIKEVNKTQLANWLRKLRTPGTGIVRV